MNLLQKDNSENSETLPIIYLLEILKIIRIFISQYRDVIKCKTIATTRDLKIKNCYNILMHKGQKHLGPIPVLRG